MKCTSPSIIHTSQGSMKVPCNRCMACRINKGQEWTVRNLFQLETQEGFFATLTYDPEFFPDNGSLSVKDMQDFNKRVRKYFSGSEKSTYKYYLCGEYGPTTWRPHYHLAMFGVDLKPEEWIFVKRSGGRDIYSSPTLSKLWPFGFNTVDYLNKTTINYVTGYIQKKLYGDPATEHYKELGRIPPFQLFSRGLGLDFLESQKAQILGNGFISVYGHKMPISKYYSQKIGLSDQTVDVDGVPVGKRSFDATMDEFERKAEWLHKHPGKTDFDYAEYVISARRQKAIDMAAYEEALPSRSKL